MDSQDYGITQLRAQLPDVVAAAVRGQITYITNRGRRLAAVVPLAVAEAAEAAQQAATDRSTR